jgi:hypothetical protein
MNCMESSLAYRDAIAGWPLALVRAGRADLLLPAYRGEVLALTPTSAL